MGSLAGIGKLAAGPSAFDIVKASGMGSLAGIGKLAAGPSAFDIVKASGMGSLAGIGKLAAGPSAFDIVKASGMGSLAGIGKLTVGPSNAALLAEILRDFDGSGDEVGSSDGREGGLVLPSPWEILVFGHSIDVESLMIAVVLGGLLLPVILSPYAEPLREPLSYAWSLIATIYALLGKRPRGDR